MKAMGINDLLPLDLMEKTIFSDEKLKKSRKV
jgi:hypothetical protein